MEKNYSILEALEYGNDYIANYYFKHNKDDIIYNCGKEIFYVWDSDLWRQYDDNSMMVLIKEYLNNDITKEQGLSDSEKKKKISSMSSPSKAVYMKNYIKALAFEHTKKNNLLVLIDAARDNMNFKNGLLNLRTGEFRKRVKTDYISNCLPYDYVISESTDEIDYINIIFKQICNNNKKMYEFEKAKLAYFMTGEIKEAKFFLSCGQGGNGKSVILESFETTFSIYCKKLLNATFSGNYGKIHKQLIDTIGKRFTYIEEITLEKLCASALKDYVAGNKIQAEKLFSTTVEFINQAKLIILCNKPPEFDTDGGIMRRGVIQEYKNVYVNDPNKVDEAANIFLAKKGLKDIFENDKYKNALVAILLPYTIAYYKDGFNVPEEYTKLFLDLCDENDKVKTYINDTFTITHREQDKISKDEFTRGYNQYNKTNEKFIHILSDIKRLGLTYNKDGSCGGKRGTILGIRYTSQDEIDSMDSKSNTKKVEESEDEVEEEEKPKKVVKKQIVKKVEVIPIHQVEIFKPNNSKVEYKKLGVEVFGKYPKPSKQTVQDSEDDETGDCLADALQCLKVERKLNTKNISNFNFN